MNKFHQIGFLTQATKDFDITSRFDALREYLEKEFVSDYQAMLDCHDDLIKLLAEGDDAAEKGNHRWCKVEAAMNAIAFGDQEWLYFQNNPVLEIDRNNA